MRSRKPVSHSNVGAHFSTKDEIICSKDVAPATSSTMGTTTTSMVEHNILYVHRDRGSSLQPSSETHQSWPCLFVPVVIHSCFSIDLLKKLRGLDPQSCETDRFAEFGRLVMQRRGKFFKIRFEAHSAESTFPPLATQNVDKILH